MLLGLEKELLIYVYKKEIILDHTLASLIQHVSFKKSHIFLTYILR